MLNLNNNPSIESLLLTLGVSLILGLLFFGSLYIYMMLRKKYFTLQSFDLLFKSIHQGTFDEETLFTIFKNRNDHLRKDYYDDISYDSFLDSFLAYAIKNDTSGSYTKEAKKIINPIFNRPYQSVNERERRILLTIDDTMMKSANLAESEKSSIKHNLDNLAMAFEENQKTLKQMKKSNELALLGILITVIFGIISIL